MVTQEEFVERALERIRKYVAQGIPVSFEYHPDPFRMTSSAGYKSDAERIALTSKRPTD